MKRLKKQLWELLTRDEGTASVEYYVIVAGVVLMVFLSLGYVGTGTANSFDKVSLSMADSSQSSAGSGSAGGSGIGNNGGRRGAGGR